LDTNLILVPKSTVIQRYPQPPASRAASAKSGRSRSTKRD